MFWKPSGAKPEMARGVGRAWIGKVLGYLFGHLSSSCADAAGAVGHPSKASLPFTILTSLSAPHAVSGITAARLPSPLPDLLTAAPGATSARRGCIHTSPRFLLSRETGVFGRSERTLRNQGKDRATEGCGAGTVSGTLITIKFGKETALRLAFGPCGLWFLVVTMASTKGSCPLHVPGPRVTLLSVPT